LLGQLSHVCLLACTAMLLDCSLSPILSSILSSYHDSNKKEEWAS
jgi:hypothetical protein